MTQPDEKSKSLNPWLVGFMIVVIACALGGALVYRPVQVARKARWLYSPDAARRKMATSSLTSMGIRGRLALLEAVGSSDKDIRLHPKFGLRGALERDIDAGRDIGPVVRAAIRGMKDPGEAGRRYAGFASEGWALGMLDEETKREIIRRCLEIKIVARPEYPVGKGWPSLHFRHHGISESLVFSYKCVHTLDGKEGMARTRGSHIGGPGSTWFGISDVTQNVGRHTLASKMEFELTECKTTGAADEIGWKMEFDTEPVSFIVRDDLPDDYLQVEATRERERLVRSCVQHHHDKDRPIYSSRVRAAKLRLDQPLPFDLAFRSKWHVAETNETFGGFGFVMLKGKTGQVWIHPRSEFTDFVKGAENFKALTITITLEPSLEEAASNPKVEAYWPRAVELPPYTLNLRSPEEVHRRK